MKQPREAPLIADSFYERIDEKTYVSTWSTAGPWGPKAQHAGPPSALLSTQMMNDHHRPDFHPARVTFELLGQIPVDDLTVRTSVEHSTHRTDLLSGTLLHHDRAVAIARMWRYKAAPSALDRVREPRLQQDGLAFDDSVAPSAPLVLAFDESVTPPVPLELTSHTDGYISAMEWRFAESEPFTTFGPGKAWVRPRIPLILGEPDTPFGRLMLIADSCWSIARRIDMMKHFAINTEITVHCHRLPESDWLRLDGTTVASPGGAAVSHATMGDRSDDCAFVLQSMFVA
ncbi:thioesterase family protein [Nocardiopsis rhodophaea]|uniref:thioesterase family protein n=1 Tax=Nocardiopsis rhodophaea TaxID=280238 RepID=UPI0031D6EB43